MKHSNASCSKHVSHVAPFLRTRGVAEYSVPEICARQYPSVSSKDVINIDHPQLSIDHLNLIWTSDCLSHTSQFA